MSVTVVMKSTMSNTNRGSVRCNAEAAYARLQRRELAGIFAC